MVNLSMLPVNLNATCSFVHPVPVSKPMSKFVNRLSNGIVCAIVFLASPSHPL